jgi:imidazolonepropionase-like amidohydrolase
MLLRFWAYNVNALAFQNPSNSSSCTTIQPTLQEQRIDRSRWFFGAASAKERLDVVIRDAINAGELPGPRYLANGKEMARRDGELCAGITAFADGPDEIREVIKKHIEVGVDQIKLSMSGEEITETRSAHDCYFTDEETAACVDEAHKAGKRVCSHARARDSVKMSLKHGVNVIYHASWIDDEGIPPLFQVVVILAGGWMDIARVWR